ncbi:MAG: radical SAM protein [Clostridia bacterium]|nr:radical SAM protein [Clostridia bacterium]
MKIKRKNIPIFIPHLGCPNMCVFCNQRSISGKQRFDREDVIGEIEAALDTLDPTAEVEIAYFGGSFTGIDRELMIYLLDLAESYVRRKEDGRAKISGIRMSTRPDYIDGDIMAILSKYSVKTVELGLQSMDDEVLKLSNRGHTAKQAEEACKMIKSTGYELIGQMMIGLPGSTLEKEIATAKKICDLGAVGARIYPTVTFFGTELANMTDRGEYNMLELDDAIFRSKEVLKVFKEHDVECIRIGLCASDNLSDETQVKGGANHAALGELVEGELCYDIMRELVKTLAEANGVQGKTLEFSVPIGELSKSIGQNSRNKKRLFEEFKPKKITIREKNVPSITLALTE